MAVRLPFAPELCESGRCVAPDDDADVVVDATVVTHTIHPEIYGGAFLTKDRLEYLGSRFNRWGGNHTSVYNYQEDLTNAGRDWYFNSFTPDPHGEGTFGTADYVSSFDVFLRDTLDVGAGALITLPTLGWAAKRGPDPRCSYPRSKYPNQTSYWNECGNGRIPGADGKDESLKGDDEDRARIANSVGPDFVRSWVEHLVDFHGSRFQDRFHAYALTNEIFLWHSTHADVHPDKATPEEVWQVTADYAPAVRAADPKGMILGYGTWNLADAATPTVSHPTHGQLKMMEWYLVKLAEHEQEHGERLVDCIDLHFYPESADDDAGRLDSTRPLWDADFHAQNWTYDLYGGPIRALPRLREWIAKWYPGTEICISEYNIHKYDAVGLLTQAEAFGLWGRHDVRLANFWRIPWKSFTSKPLGSGGDGDVALPAAYAFLVYGNYDGEGGRFGDQSLSTAVTVDELSAFGARRSSDSALTVMLVNRSPSSRTIELNVRGITSGTAERWQSVAGQNAITKEASVPVSGGSANVPIAGRAVEIVVIR